MKRIHFSLAEARKSWTVLQALISFQSDKPDTGMAGGTALAYAQTCLLAKVSPETAHDMLTEAFALAHAAAVDPAEATAVASDILRKITRKPKGKG